MGLNIGCAAAPGQARDNKTGSWRVFKPEVDHEKCTKCGNCVMVCPETAVYLNDDAVVIDLDFCKGCGLCAEECPTDAITMNLEDK